MSDNILNFTKRAKETDTSKIQERIMTCIRIKEEKNTCDCKYCTYHKTGAKMILDLLVKDILNFENNVRDTKTCTHDLKEVLLQALLDVNEMEKS